MNKEKNKEKFKVGDKVILNDCPYDEQIGSELEKYVNLKGKVQIVKTTAIAQHAQLIKTDLEPEFIDSGWYDLAQSAN